MAKGRRERICGCESCGREIVLRAGASKCPYCDYVNHWGGRATTTPQSYAGKALEEPEPEDEGDADDPWDEELESEELDDA